MIMAKAGGKNIMGGKKIIQEFTCISKSVVENGDMYKHAVKPILSDHIFFTEKKTKQTKTKTSGFYQF